MFAVVKRSLSSAIDKLATIGQQNIKSTVKLDYLKFTPKESAAINAPILLYHGKFTSKELWTPVADSIANATKRNVFSVDLRNHGGIECTTTDGSHVMALDMKKFMDEQNISNGVLLGHSLGGRAVMEMALHYPKMVEKLVVFDTEINVSTKRLSSLFLIDQLLLRFIKKIDPQMKLEEAKDQLKNLLSLEFKDPCSVEIMSNTLEKVNGKFQYSFKIESLWKARIHHLDVTNTYDGECLFIYGNSGFVVEKDFIRIQAAFPNVTFVHINTGHYGMVENPTLFSKLVTNFINGS